MGKFHLYRGIAKAINMALHNRYSLTFYMVGLSALLAFVSIPLSDDFIRFWLVLSLAGSLLSLTTVRLSNNSIYNPIMKFLSMNIGKFEGYHTLHYVEQKKEVADLYQEEFIEAIENAHRRGYKTIKMTTHNWVWHKVLLNERVTSKYDVIGKEKGTSRIPLEVLLLTSDNVAKHDKERVWNEAMKQRKQFKVVLKRK